MSTGSDIIRYFTQAQGFFYRPIPKLWYFILFSVFWLKPFAYHLSSLCLVSGITILLYVYFIEKGIHRYIAWGMAFLFSVLSIHHENIFWISGQSSLLSAFFFMGSLVLFQRFWTKTGRFVTAYASGGAVCLFVSMLSYDGTVMMPIVIFLLSVFVYEKGKKTWPVLLLIPFYWGIRTYAGALMPSGDYGYKWTTFIVNSIGNSIGYSLGIVIGPRAIEYISVLRAVSKQYILQITGLILVITAVFLAAVYRFRSKVISYKDIVTYGICAFISAGAYLGLGNASERYALIPSICIVIAFGLWISRFFSSTQKPVYKIAAFGAIALCSWWNIGETQRLFGDWTKASDIAKTSLLAIKQEIYPPKDDLTFFFVDPPIRYGRAWIFPIGLQDALWHMFRDNVYAVNIVPSIKAAYDFPIYKGTRYVYVFVDYVLKKGIEKTVE